MKKIKYIFFLYFILTLNIFAKNKVSNIRINKKTNSLRIVIDNTEKINFNTFILKDPYRLIVDLQNTNINIEANDFKANDIVNTIRIGKFSENDIRLVFDLNIKCKINKSFYLSPNDEHNFHRVVIDIDFDNNDLIEENLISKIIDEIDFDNNSLNNEELNNLIEKELMKERDNNKNIPNKTNTNTNIKTTKNNTNKKKYRIIIDAGHGGKDPGAIGTMGTKEKIITLLYAKSLKTELEKNKKYQVFLTRDYDHFIELNQRVSIARKYKGDLFISIHGDSSTNKQAKGLSIYILSQTASDTRTAELAKKENKADILGGINLYGEYQDTINTLVDISRKNAMNESNKYSKILKNKFEKNNINFSGKAIKSANFAVLLSADMPSVLIELGFLSNRSDEKMIRSNKYKDKINKGIVESIDEYFKNK